MPISNALSEECAAKASLANDVCWKDRLFTTGHALGIFGQVLSADSSCRAAVAWVVAHPLSLRHARYAAETGAYRLRILLFGLVVLNLVRFPALWPV